MDSKLSFKKQSSFISMSMCSGTMEYVAKRKLVKMNLNTMMSIKPIKRMKKNLMKKKGGSGKSKGVQTLLSDFYNPVKSKVHIT